MKFFNLKSMIGMFLILFMAACQDDTGSGAKVEEGLAAKLNLSIQVPAVEEVNTRAIADNESQINELALFMYSENGSSVNYSVNLTDYLWDNGTTGNGNRTYSLTGDVSVKTGTFTVYAVANWSSLFANSDLGSYVTNGEVPSQADLKTMLAHNSNVLALGSGYLPMTCVVPNVTFSVAEEDGTNSLSLSLKRATARIEFTVQNGEPLKEVQGEFIPSTFQVFNLPLSSYLFDQGDNTVLTRYFDSAVMDVNEDGSFEFLMNENVRPAGENINEYKDREYYEGNWTNPTSFKNAPDGSTYVVINGYYRDNRQSGPVSYRIHLGNFSKTGSITNFTVNRNEQHLYKVTVNGIDNISTEAEVKNPGAYGDVQVRTLEFASEPEAQDAHYVIYPIQINTNNLSGNWTVEVENPGTNSWVTLKKESELSDFQREGYWTANELGGSSVTGSESGTQTIYAFLEENVNDERTATLALYQTGYPASKVTFDIKQLPVNWNGTFGTERIEDENTYPWGFNWDRKVTFSAMPKFSWPVSLVDLFGAYIYRGIARNIVSEYNAEDYITINDDYKIIGLVYRTDVTIDYSKLNDLQDITDDNDGHANTIALYNHRGIGAVSELENILRDNAVGNFEEHSEGSDDASNIENFAAKMCVMKNKFYTEERTVEEQGQTHTYQVVVIHDEDLKWYLPAANEYTSINDSQYPLDGTYWTSSAANDNTHAKTFTAPSSIGNDGRMQYHKIRAARVRN